MAAGLTGVVKLLAKGAAKQAPDQSQLKRVMYTNQERSGQIGGSFKSIEGFDPELKRPIVGDDITNLNSRYIEVESPAGAILRRDAKLMVDPEVGTDIPVGNPTAAGKVKVKTNLIDSGNGSRWTWTKVPKGYENNTFIVAVEGPAKFTPNGSHAYTLKTIFEKGGNLTGYDKRNKQFKGMSLEETERMLEEKLKTATGKERKRLRDQLRGQPPHGRPTTEGIPEFGPVVGEIKMAGKNGKKHPVYEYIVMRNKGGKIGSVVERNPYEV